MNSNPAHMLRCAADQIERAAAVHLSVTHSSRPGITVHGEFVVTHDRYGTGTITDRDDVTHTDGVVGRADYLATPFTVSVRGDDGWWALRAPAHAGRHVDTWTRPDHGVAYPVAVVDAFNPETLSGLLRERAKDATITPGSTDVGTEKTVIVQSGGWTITVTAAFPHDVVCMDGPVRFRVPAQRTATPLHMAINIESIDSGTNAVRLEVTTALASSVRHPAVSQ